MLIYFDAHSTFLHLITQAWKKEWSKTADKKCLSVSPHLFHPFIRRSLRAAKYQAENLFRTWKYYCFYKILFILHDNFESTKYAAYSVINLLSNKFYQLLEYSSFFSAESFFHQLVESLTFILLSHLLLHYYKRNSEAMISRISCQSVRSFQTSRNLFKRIRSPRTQQNVLNVSQHSPLFFPLRTCRKLITWTQLSSFRSSFRKLRCFQLNLFSAALYFVLL